MSISAINARVDQIMAMASMDATVTGPPQKAATSSFADALATAQKTPAATAPAATAETFGAGSPSSDPQMASRLDAWMAKHTPGSPLVGHGADFVRAGAANGIDPRFLVAVAAQESALGTAGSGKDINNPFGWGPARPFSSWTESIDTVAAGLAKGYLGEGRDTIAAIQAKWAPVGAANDPTGLNSNWTTGVSKFYAEMGGTPGGSIRA
ncbi:MAG: glucosaminidase domain-containing protein [Thermoleophilia bacterium]|nr:glucosaminidase domain-containing protein [Thermoleophilia bacterium]